MRGARAGLGAALHPRASLEHMRAAVELIVREEVIATAQSSLNGPMSGTRHFATVQLDLADVKAIKTRMGGTVNDVVLALCAGGLRHLLLSRGDDLPEGNLRAQVPVNIRTEDQEHSLGNELTSLFVDLPVAEADPTARYRAVAERAAARSSPGRSGPAARRSSTSRTWDRRSPVRCWPGRCSAAPGCST